jgi:hypothetical protein
MARIVGYIAASLDGFIAGWAYGAQRVFVVTSRPIDDPLGPLETRSCRRRRWARG